MASLYSQFDFLKIGAYVISEQGVYGEMTHNTQSYVTKVGDWSERTP